MISYHYIIQTQLLLENEQVRFTNNSSIFIYDEKLDIVTRGEITFIILSKDYTGEDLEVMMQLFDHIFDGKGEAGWNETRTSFVRTNRHSHNTRNSMKKIMQHERYTVGSFLV